MKINTDINNKNLVVVLDIDVTPLQEMLELLFEFEFCALKCIFHKRMGERFSFFFNSIINDSNILDSNFVITSFTYEANQLVCVFDFDITNFFRQWSIAMRTGNFNSNTFFHNGFPLSG